MQSPKRLKMSLSEERTEENGASSVSGDTPISESNMAAHTYAD